MGNGTFTLTKNYDDDKYFTEAILDAIKAEIEAQFNTVNKNNMDQLKADLFASGYTFDDDGSGNLTSPLYNKQTAVNSYYTNVSLGTSADADFTNADATNLVLTFTPEVAGKYLVKMSFPMEIVPTGGNNLVYQCHFRLTDSGASPASSSPKTLKFTSATNDETFGTIINLEGIFTFTAAAQTIKLQKRIITATDVSTHTMLGSAGLYGFDAMAIKL